MEPKHMRWPKPASVAFGAAALMAVVGTIVAISAALDDGTKTPPDPAAALVQQEADRIANRHTCLRDCEWRFLEATHRRPDARTCDECRPSLLCPNDFTMDCAKASRECLARLECPVPPETACYQMCW